MSADIENNGMKQKRWPWIVAAVLLSAIVIPFCILLTHWPFTREKVTTELQKRFPGPVEMQKFHSVYFPHPGCVIEGLVVHSSSANAQRPLIAAERLELDGAYSDLFASVKHLEIATKGLRVLVPHHYDAHANALSASKTIIKQFQADDALLEVDREGNDPIHFDIHSIKAGPLSIDKAMPFHVAMKNPLPEGELKVDGDFGPMRPDAMGETPVSGSYTFDNADLGVFSAIAGVVSSTGKFQGVLGKLAVDGSLHSPDFEVRKSDHRVSLAGQFQAEVNGTNGDVIVRKTSITWGKTTLVASGDISGKPRQPGKTVSLDLSVHGGRIQDLMLVVMHSSPTMDGPTSFRGRAVLPPGKAPFIRRVQFVADFGIDDAQFTRAGAQNGINLLSERARGDKNNNLEQVLSDLKGRVVLRNGIATVEHGSLAVPAAVAHFTGAADMVSKEVNLHGQLRMAATVSQASTGFKSVLLKFVDPFFKDKKHHAGADIPVKLTGTFSQPQFAIDLFHH